MPTYASVARDEPRASSSAAVVYPDEPNDQDTSFGEQEETHDYTEGAKESDIAEAIEVRGRNSGRRDSMSGWDDGDGNQTSIFSGPAAYSIPSSVTSMHHAMPQARHSFAARRSSSRMSFSSRRPSEDGRRPTQSRADSARSNVSIGTQLDRRRADEEEAAAGEDGQTEEGGVLGGVWRSLGFGASRNEDEEEGGEDRVSRKSRRSFTSQRSRSRPFVGRRSSSRSNAPSEAVSDGDASPPPSSDENWGYSSNDDEGSETSSRGSFRSENNDLVPPSSRPHSPTSPSIMPLLPADHVFHNDRPIDSDDLDMAGSPFPSTAGSKAKQVITLPDEDLSIFFVGYATVVWKEIIWWMGCILSAGILGLIGRWVPRIWVRWVGREKDFSDDEQTNRWVLVETPYKDLNIVPLQTIPYPYPLSTVFPSSSSPPATASNTVTGHSTPRQPSISGSTSNTVPDAKDLVPNDLERGSMTWEDTMGFLKIVEYRYTKFALDERNGQWRMIRDWRDHLWTSVKGVSSGLDESTREQRRILFGQNAIDIEGKGVITILLDEVLHPFYVFQVASIVLWSLDDYYYYAFAIALISISSILQTLFETRRTIERMREMSRFSCDVQALINGEWKTVDSATLVPGDIFDAADPSLPICPCDAVLLSGDAIVNESMLTGESVPVSKIPIKDDGLIQMSKEKSNGSTDVSPDLAKHYLFSGTGIIRVRPTGGGTGTPGGADRAPALVVRTGFNTTKGALVRSMLFPKPMGFKFYRDSLNFIGVLALIAGLGFLVSVGKFIEIGIKWHTILVRALDLITVVVPPALPATLSIGTTFAIDRLRKAGIFCISPNRVNIGGKINVVCFDKTGTLTEEGLEVLGVRTIDKSTGRFSELHSDVAEVPPTGGENGKTPLLYALATCHSLKRVGEETIGDPLDIEMFNFTNWILEEGRAGKPAAPAADGKAKPVSKPVERPQTLVQTVVRPASSEAFQVEDALKSGSRHAHFLELGVIRTFDFVSSLRRMSVVVKRLKSPSMEVYVKGAPEVMADICDPSTFPKDYDDLLSYYTKHGFRVIAIAGKTLEGLNWIKAQKMKRETAESNLHFLGLIIFENKLKPGTTPAIATLRGAHLACRMVTGDNIRTAVSVARECGLVSQSATVYLPTFSQGNSETADSRVEWSSVDDEGIQLDEYSLRPKDPPTDQFGEPDDEPHEYSLAVTGEVFRWMVDYAPVDTFQRMLIKGVIFARMSPDEKHELVERLQGLGYTVCFCGDGANDVGALKAADVGISLSEAEASVAAPFTSRTPDISCVIEVIKEGRAALVTSFSCFKFMALYSLIQFTTITLLYSFASSLGDFQFLFIDLFLIIPVAVAMGRTLPFPEIHPKRPTGSLVSKRVLTSIISQTLINGFVQLGVFLLVRTQSWYTEPDVNVDKLETLNYENTALFLVSSFQYLVVAAVFSVGPPYRKPIWSNPSLVACLSILMVFSTYILLFPAPQIAVFLDLMALDMSFKLQLLSIVALNIVLCFASERYAETALVKVWVRGRNWWRGKRSRGRRSGGKLYKSIPA